MGIHVLSGGHWPIQRVVTVTLPREFVICKSKFESWYSSQYSHRSLKWIWSLGDVTIYATYGNRMYDIQMGVLQVLYCTVLYTLLII